MNDLLTVMWLLKVCLTLSDPHSKRIAGGCARRTIKSKLNLSVPCTPREWAIGPLVLYVHHKKVGPSGE